MHLIRTFQRQAAEVGRARCFVADALRRSGREATDDVLLVTSELVANAVAHGSDPVEVHLELVDGTLHLEVHDAGGVDLEPAEMPAAGSRGGRGLPLVAAVTKSSGTEIDPRGHTIVWADLAAPRSDEPEVR